jgi:hypothetical protein
MILERKALPDPKITLALRAPTLVDGLGGPAVSDALLAVRTAAPSGIPLSTKGEPSPLKT